MNTGKAKSQTGFSEVTKQLVLQLQTNDEFNILPGLVNKLFCSFTVTNFALFVNFGFSHNFELRIFESSLVFFLRFIVRQVLDLPNTNRIIYLLTVKTTFVFYYICVNM